jgi:putative SOS response-associated peptidase YedK
MSLLAAFHSRSPLILDDSQVERWLDPALRDAREIAKAFVPHGSQGFEIEMEDWGKGTGQMEMALG